MADQMIVEYVNAGHPPPYVRLPDGTVSALPLAEALPVGLLAPGTVVHGETLTLPLGSMLVLYTDGLVERRDRGLADGLTALASALRDAPDGTAAQVRDHLLSVLADGAGEDDLCLLVVRFPSEPV
jgi:serine phosphatase RsbU (regulator of sigma subunit)